MLNKNAISCICQLLMIVWTGTFKRLLCPTNLKSVEWTVYINCGPMQFYSNPMRSQVVNLIPLWHRWCVNRSDLQRLLLVRNIVKKRHPGSHRLMGGGTRLSVEVNPRYPTALPHPSCEEYCMTKSHTKYARDWMQTHASLFSCLISTDAINISHPCVHSGCVLIKQTPAHLELDRFFSNDYFSRRDSHKATALYSSLGDLWIVPKLFGVSVVRSTCGESRDVLRPFPIRDSMTVVGLNMIRPR